MSSKNAGVTPSEFAGTTDRLPDALAFMRGNRTEFWLTLREYDNPQPVEHLVDETDYSSATIYRMLDELTEADLAERVYSFDENGRQRHAYRAIDPTNGGDRR